MERRELLKMIALLTGATVVGGELFLAGCKNADTASTLLPLNAASISLLDEVAETIIPKTETPGAKEAAAGSFMNRMVTDCYETPAQQAFTEGITSLKNGFSKKYSKEFTDAGSDQRMEFLNGLEKEARDFNEKKKTDDPPHYYTMIKQLTLLGYFTSEPGATRALRYIAIPGKYTGDIPYVKGEKAWATS